MQHLKITGLCLVAMIATGMVIATAASAAPVWEQCATEKAGSAATKYTEHLCNTASGAGGWAWQQVPATAPQAIHVRGTLALKDTKTLLGESEVECSVEEEGKAGGSTSKIEKITTIGCRSVKVCEGTPTVKATDLPWETEFFETEKKVLQTLKGTTSGEPGWNVKCKVSGIEMEDECAGEKGVYDHLDDIAIQTSVVGWLLLEDYTNFRTGNCTQGGKEAGEVLGSDAFLYSNGWALRVS